MTPPKKIRLDQLLVNLSLASDPESARRFIMAGSVRTGDRVWDKPGTLIPTDTPLTVKRPDCPFVSRGGLKLAKAFDALKFSPKGKTCLDIGASTGGFTDVLLLREAARVTALDVGRGQLDWKLRQDRRVKVIERVNFRKVPQDFFPKQFDVIVVDVSFISLELVVPKACDFLVDDGDLFALIKPQFEARRGQVSAGGIVTDPSVHLEVVMRILEALSKTGVFFHGLVSVTESEKKNREFVSWWRKQPSKLPEIELLRQIQDIVPGNKA